MSLENPDDEAEMLTGYTGGKTQTVLPLEYWPQCGACHLETTILANRRDFVISEPTKN